MHCSVSGPHGGGDDDDDDVDSCALNNNNNNNCEMGNGNEGAGLCTIKVDDHHSDSSIKIRR